ncbi:MAG: hypothetical protein PHQ14_08390, partial [Chromatiales bacterium]|nr:hypothetical protein [Chromatiales bacterium]
GVRELAERFRQKADSGEIFALDNGAPWNGVSTGYDIATAGMVFAFMAQIEQDPAARDAWGKRARNMVMYVVDRVLAPQDGLYFHAPAFAVNYRGNFHGEAIPSP